MNWLLVIIGAMVGDPLRYLTDRAVQQRHDTVFPWGTFTVNVVGCLILALLSGAVAAGAASSHVQLLLGTGLCGALTTYSTFSYETLRLAEDGARYSVIRFQVCAWSGSVYRSTSWHCCTPSETRWWIARRSGSGI
ncbi:fluoride efflux transporter CrcB [Streptomyces griseofuscus]|uniref:fluoride efflux transporter CrcB n=1 Tax=Streptomyces griseofuscus TaxID=146922 RepID=UPI00379C9657